MEATLGQRLKILIKEKGIEQRKAAADLGLKTSTFSGYVLDKREPTLACLKKMAAYFDTSIDYLVGYSDVRAPYLSHLSSEQKEFITAPENAMYIDLARDIKEKTRENREIIKRVVK